MSNGNFVIDVKVLWSFKFEEIFYKHFNIDDQLKRAELLVDLLNYS